MKKSDWLSLFAFIISIIALVLILLKTDFRTTGDAFIAIMAGFMGACATLIIGVQIYNSIDTRYTINELNKSFEEKIKALDKSIDSQLRDSRVLQNELNYELTNTKKELERAKEERKKNEFTIDAGIAQCYGLSLSEKQPFTAINSFYTAFNSAMQTNDTSLVEDCLRKLEVQLTIIEHLQSDNIFKAHMEDTKEMSFNKFNEHPYYLLIEDRCNKLQQGLGKKILAIEQYVKEKQQ
ncbi:MAG: hypothetical protein RSD11_11695 [Bacteroides sp.]|uniref:hypothetical protein n=1 Tax=Bacteroides sp. TaxID=29523 RepID=UPI002FCC578D